MSWTLIIALGAGSYLFKVLGLVVVGARSLPPVVERCLVLIPAAMLSALIVKDVFSEGQELVIDARVVGAAVAAQNVLRHPCAHRPAIGDGIPSAQPRAQRGTHRRQAHQDGGVRAVAALVDAQGRAQAETVALCQGGTGA